MATKPIKKSVLLKTSLATDIQSSGGVISVAGLIPVSKRNISAIRQVKSKAETAQIVTVSTTAAPTGSTPYIIAVYDPLRVQAGYTEATKTYSYTTTASLVLEGATAALQREYINAQIITKINNDTANNHATATTSGTGTGFTITDAGSYYPVRAQNMSNIKGVNTVLAITNSDGSGFATSVVSVTTAGVYSFGTGAKLLTENPIIDFIHGNLISGVLDDAPLTATNPPAPAVSGQNYDCFVIEFMQQVDAFGGDGQYAYKEGVQRIFVDNGTGSATTNLAGFVAFEREMLRVLFGTYASDSTAIVDFFDQGLIASATYPTTGAAVSTTDNVVMAYMSNSGQFNNEWYVNPQSTHTLLTPIIANNATTATNGLRLLLDLTDEEGIEFSAPNDANCPKQFVVGKQEFSIYARITAADFRHLEEFSIGFREKLNTALTNAYAATLAAYDAAGNDFAVLGNGTEAVTGLQRIMTSLASAGVVSTSTAVTYTTNVTHDYLITVDINGLCRFYLDGVEKTSLQATQFSFAAGAVLIPFIITALDANVDAAPLLTQIAVVPSITWRS